MYTSFFFNYLEGGCPTVGPSLVGPTNEDSLVKVDHQNFMCNHNYFW